MTNISRRDMLKKGALLGMLGPLIPQIFNNNDTAVLEAGKLIESNRVDKTVSFELPVCAPQKKESFIGYTATPKGNAITEMDRWPISIGQGNIDTNIDDIFERIAMSEGTLPEFPLDFLVPEVRRPKGIEAFYSNGPWNNPGKETNKDYIHVPYFNILWQVDGVSHAGHWSKMKDMMQELLTGIKTEIEDTAWHCILAACQHSSKIKFHTNSKLVNIINILSRNLKERYNRPINLTDIYMSQKMYDKMILGWQHYFPLDMAYEKIKFHAIDGLGKGQKYHEYINTIQTHSIFSGELFIGITNTNNDFVMPIKNGQDIVTMYFTSKPTLHKQEFHTTMDAEAELGLAVLDNRSIVVGHL